MTTKENAGDKLVASIRKTKAGTGTATGTQTARKKVVKKTVQRTRKSITSTKKTTSTSTNKKQIVDLFQSGRRVWPD